MKSRTSAKKQSDSYKSRLSPRTLHKPHIHIVMMDARTAATAADSARVNARHALKLRVVRHKHAARIAAPARAKKRHAHQPVRLNAWIHTSSIAIAGPDCEE